MPSLLCTKFYGLKLHILPSGIFYIPPNNLDTVPEIEAALSWMMKSFVMFQVNIDGYVIAKAAQKL